MPNGVSRHVFSACAVGVGAVLTSPAMEESWAASSLPIIGGRNASQAGPVDWPTKNDPVLHFDLARTEVIGTGPQAGPQQGERQYTTIIRKTVNHVNILNRLTCSIGVTLTFVYTATNNRAFDPVEVTIDPLQPFANLRINDAPFQMDNLEAKIPLRAGQNFRTFRQGPDSIDQLRPDNRHLKHTQGEGPNGHGQGVIFTALAEPVPSFTYESPDFGRIDVSGLGRVYFAEWRGEPYHQSLGLLRVELENAQDRLKPGGRFTGQIVIGDDENGRTYP